jgi:16S rRNA (guanine527-N7)-methyltransferase
VTHPLRAGLREGLAALELELREGQVQQLLDFSDLLQKWTKVYNLTAVREPAEVLTHHLLDCLAIIRPLQTQLAALKVVPPTRMLDVGSGGGLPGVVLAICFPENSVHCVDAVAKKAAFIKQASLNLGLPKLQGVHQRIEGLEGQYGVVISRAFASLGDFARLSEQALVPGGIWLAMKAKVAADEMAGLSDSAEVFHVEPLAVPGLSAQRTIVWMRRKSAAQLVA